VQGESCTAVMGARVQLRYQVGYSIVSLCFLHVFCSLGMDTCQQGRVQRLRAHEYSLGSKRNTCLFLYNLFFCKLWILQEGTGVSFVEYGGDGCTTTAS
jgi:hypothetical protein